MAHYKETAIRELGPEDIGRRLDKVLRSFLPGLSLAGLYKALRLGTIRINGKKSRPEYRLESGDRLSLPRKFLPPRSSVGPCAAADDTPSTVPCPEYAAANDAPADAAIDNAERQALALLKPMLVLESAQLLAFNKPRGMLVHGAGGLESLVKQAHGRESRESLSFKPGPLHRLDRNSSGLIFFSRGALGARVFSELLRSRRLKKFYLALLEGSIQNPETWIDRLGRDEKNRRSLIDPTGREAICAVFPIAQAGSMSLALLRLDTGFTHQIRVQAAAHGHPLAGDRKYGGAALQSAGGRVYPGYILHALRLEFPEKPFPDVPSRVSAPLPPKARSFLATLFNEAALIKVETGDKA